MGAPLPNPARNPVRFAKFAGAEAVLVFASGGDRSPAAVALDATREAVVRHFERRWRQTLEAGDGAARGGGAAGGGRDGETRAGAGGGRGARREEGRWHMPSGDAKELTQFAGAVARRVRAFLPDVWRCAGGRWQHLLAPGPHSCPGLCAAAASRPRSAAASRAAGAGGVESPDQFRSASPAPHRPVAPCGSAEAPSPRGAAGRRAGGMAAEPSPEPRPPPPEPSRPPLPCIACAAAGAAATDGLPFADAFVRSHRHACWVSPVPGVPSHVHAYNALQRSLREHAEQAGDVKPRGSGALHRRPSSHTPPPSLPRLLV